MKHLTNREEEIMDIFWEKGSLYVKEIVDELADPKPHYNTISTTVDFPPPGVPRSINIR